MAFKLFILKKSTSTSADSIKAYLIGILLLIIIFYLLIWFLKSYKKNIFFGQKRHIKIVESISLSKDNNLHIVLIDDEYILFGSSNGRIDLLKHLDKKMFDNMDSLKSDVKLKKSFVEILREKFGGIGEK